MTFATGLPRLPPNWVWTRLGDLADVVGGVTKDAKRQTDPSFVEVPYLRVANVQRGFLDLNHVATIRVSKDKAAALKLRHGDILFTEGGDRDKLGRGWVWEGQIDDCIHQNHIFRARLYSTELEPKFISWHGNAFGQAWFVAAGKQTTNLASISLTTMKSLPIPVPPVAEQRRIIAEVDRQLSRVDAGAYSLRRARRNLRRMRITVLNEAALGRLVLQDPSDAVKLPRESRKPDDAALATLPVGWTWARLDAIASVQGGIQKQPKRKPVANHFPFLRVANVLQGGLALEDVHRIELFEEELDRYRLLPDDLLVVEGNGSLNQLGRSALWRGEIADCVHQNHLIRVRPLPYIDAAYLNFIWNSSILRAHLQAVASSTSGLHTLSVSKLKIIPVPIPPMAEQRRIVAEVERQLSLVKAAEQAVERESDRAVSLRRTILQAAFEGRLVPQEPEDEPATMLLQRVAAGPVSNSPERPKQPEQGTLL